MSTTEAGASTILAPQLAADGERRVFHGAAAPMGAKFASRPADEHHHFRRQLRVAGTKYTIRIADRTDNLGVTWPTTGDIGQARCFAFQCADVLGVWQRTLGAERRIVMRYVAIVEGDNTAVALLPLVIEATLGIRVLKFPDADVSDYNAPVLFPAAKALTADSFAAVWSAILGSLPQVDACILEKMPDMVGDLANPMTSLAVAPYPNSGHVLEIEADQPNGGAASEPRRRSSNRKRRKLAAMGDLRLVVAQDDVEAARLLDVLLTLKERHYLQAYGANRLARPGYRNYYQHATQTLMASGCAHVAALMLDDTALAVGWGFIVAERYYSMMIGYDEAWKRFSPGRALQNELVGWAARHGVRIYDQGVGDFDYKTEYCKSTVPLMQHVIATSARGWAYLALRDAKHRLRKMQSVQSLRVLVGRRLGTYRIDATGGA